MKRHVATILIILVLVFSTLALGQVVQDEEPSILADHEMQHIEPVFSKTYEVPSPVLIDSSNGVYISWDGVYLTDGGAPRVPIMFSNVLLPPGTMGYDVTVEPEHRIIEELDSDIEIFSGSQLYGESEEDSPLDIGGVYPGDVEGFHSINSMRGFDVLTIPLYPYHFDLDSHQLVFYESITVEVHSTEIGEADLTYYRGTEEDKARIESIIDNPGSISVYEDKSLDADILDTSYELDYVVIAPESFEEGYSEFIEWKNKLGLRTKFVSTEDIYGNHPGVDEQAKIREYLNHSYLNKGLSYALLGGCTDNVPHRGTWVDAGNDPRLQQHIPNDLYYAELTSEWNKEGSDWGNVDHDEGGAFADIYVGRFPARNIDEASAMSQKTIAYELLLEGYDTNTLYRSTFYNRPLDSNTHGMDHAEDDLIPKLPASWEDEIYKTTSASDAVDQMNSGMHFLNNLAHGDSSSFGGVYSSDMAGLTNEEYFLLYTQACNSGRFDGDCVLEYGMRNLDGGPFATIGNTRYGLYYPENPSYGENAMMNTQFYEFLFNSSVTRLGEAHYRSKEVYGNWIFPPGPDESDPDPNGWKTMNSWRYIYFGLNLMGDPSLGIYTDYQGRAEASYDEEIFAGDVQLEVYTEPLSNVTLYRKGDVFVRAQADLSGYVHLETYIPSEGTMNITVTKPNYAPYVGTIDVGEFVPGDPPSIEVITPSGGEQWTAGTEQEISWTTEEGEDPIDRIDLWYSTDSGISWRVLTTGLPDQGSYVWDIPNEPTEEGRIRARVVDELGRNSDDISQGLFEIIGIPPSPPSNLRVEHYGEDERIDVFEEDFSGIPEGYIPEGWTRDSSYWGVSYTDDAGGGSPELRFGNLPSGSGTIRCYTPPIDTSEHAELNLTFRHYFNFFFGSSITLRVEASTDGNDWMDVWSVSTSSDIPAEQVSIVLDDDHGIGSESFRLSWTFQGSANDIRRWCIDDISLFTEIESDGTEHNLVAWDASPDDPEEVIHYNLYRSDSYDGPWNEPFISIPVSGEDDYTYIDQNKGSEDDILWWYLLRAVGINGLEEENTDAVQEPGAELDTFEVQLESNVDADGWNFVSFNLIPSDSSLITILEDQDNGIAGNYDKVMYYDSSVGMWSSYVPGRADHFNDLNTWNHRMGLWIHMTTSDTLIVEGSIPTSTTITLGPGWNMVGYPSLDPGGGVPEEVDRIGHFDGSQPYHIDYIYDIENFTFEPGKGYLIHNNAEYDVIWTVEY